MKQETAEKPVDELTDREIMMELSDEERQEVTEAQCHESDTNVNLIVGGEAVAMENMELEADSDLEAERGVRINAKEEYEGSFTVEFEDEEELLKWLLATSIVTPNPEGTWFGEQYENAEAQCHESDTNVEREDRLKEWREFFKNGSGTA